MGQRARDCQHCARRVWQHNGARWQKGYVEAAFCALFARTASNHRTVVTQSSVDKKVANGLSVDESLKVLSFDDAKPTSLAEISARAKTMFELNAPNEKEPEKEPGSPYLQAKVYWSRVRLEHAIQHGELKLDEAPPSTTTTSAAAAAENPPKSE
jgi:hypothetical protein